MEEPLPHRAALGLGSNVGDRRRAIEGALAVLGACRAIGIEAVSSIIETAPVGPSGQGPYLNAAVVVETDLTPRELLSEVQAIEAVFGRSRTGRVRWGPRTLDVDILLYDRLIIDEPQLRIPHPLLPERPFALIPLAEIADSWLHPGLGVTIECLRDAVATSVDAE